MPREAEQSSNEHEFILQALRQNLRIDGRATDTYRNLELTFGEEHGSCNVTLGKTKVAVVMSCEVTIPTPERKFDGIFTITAELSPMASASFEVGRQNVTEILLSRILEKTIRRSSALDTESLCIIAGAKCFHLRADIHILDHDGNLVDASCLALVAALQHFRRPDVAVQGENVTIFTSREREPVPLSLLHHPLCVTISYYDEGNIALIDATLAEELVREGEITFSMNAHGELCQIAKYGGTAVDARIILNWASIVLVKVKELSQFIRRRLDEDAKARDAGGLMAELSAENERPT